MTTVEAGPVCSSVGCDNPATRVHSWVTADGFNGAVDYCDRCSTMIIDWGHDDEVEPLGES